MEYFCYTYATASECSCLTRCFVFHSDAVAGELKAIILKDDAGNDAIMENNYEIPFTVEVSKYVIYVNV